MMSNTGTVIFENIYRYLTLVWKARSSSVSTWTQSSIKNIFQWADYCEKLYEDIHQKKWVNGLSKKLREIQQLPVALQKDDLNIAYLRDSKAHIFKILLSNKHLPRSCFRFCLETCGLETDVLLKIVLDIVDEDSHSRTESEAYPQHSIYQLCGEALLEYLQQRMSVMLENDARSKFIPDLVQLVISSSTADSVGNTLLGCLLAVEHPTQEPVLLTIFESLLNALRERDLLRADVDLLRTCSEKHYSVWHLWIDVLLASRWPPSNTVDLSACSELEQRLERHVTSLYAAAEHVRGPSAQILLAHAQNSVLWTRVVTRAQRTGQRVKSSPVHI